MIIGSRAGRMGFAVAVGMAALGLSGCTVAPAGKAPLSVWQCPGGSVDLARNEAVRDPYRIAAGQGASVRGLNGWEGRISGVPVAGSRFSRLLIGMRPAEVAQLLGAPSDYGSYEGRADDSLYHFGSDRVRYEMLYRGQGRLVFSTRNAFGPGRYLTWIIHDPRDDVAAR